MTAPVYEPQTSGESIDDLRARLKQFRRPQGGGVAQPASRHLQNALRSAQRGPAPEKSSGIASIFIGIHIPSAS